LGYCFKLTSTMATPGTKMRDSGTNYFFTFLCTQGQLTGFASIGASERQP
jgi:hypothetical protein